MKNHAHPTAGFAWLRLIGATIVVIDHTWPLLQTQRATILPDPWVISPGYVALMGFFAMSGFQISDSWERDPSAYRFVAKRLLRLLPPLFVVVAVTVFVIGPLFTTWELGQYWGSLQTWQYLVGTSLILLLQHKLPGVFADNPYPWSVNGSLWTIPMEFLCYGLVLVVGLLIAFGVTRLVLFPLLAGLLVLDGTFQATFNYHGDAGSIIEIPIGSLVSFAVPFAMGMILHTYRRRIPYYPSVALGLVPVWLVLHSTPVGRYVLPVMAGYGAIVLAHHWPQRLVVHSRWISGSYGMYIWAFAIQQILISVGVTNQWALMACAVPLAYGCGVLSWCYIESPTLSLRGRLGVVRQEPQHDLRPRLGQTPQ